MYEKQNMKKTTNENVNHSLETARGFIKTAREYAHYKKTEGYNDDNFSFLEIVNLDASLDVCRRGPADYYFEKAYDLLCNELGKDHSETRELVKETIAYHVNNVKRMMAERCLLIGSILLLPIHSLVDHISGSSQQKVIGFALVYTCLIIYWHIEQAFICFMEKTYYSRIYYAKERFMFYRSFLTFFHLI